MAVLEKYINEISIDESKLNHVIHEMVEFTNIKSDYKSHSAINKKETMIDLIIPLFEKYLELNIAMDKSKKLEIIDVLDKFNFRKEILEILKTNIDLKNTEKAGMRLGNKSQSAFEKK